MTDEERQRTMNFLLEHQAQMAASVQRQEEEIQRLEQERIRDRSSWAEWRKSFKILVQLNLKYDERLADLDSSTAALERKTLSLEDAHKALAWLVEKNKVRLDRLESRS